jgi:prolyl oligopeptidase
MKNLLICSLLMLRLSALAQPIYPTSRKSAQEDVYFGKTIPDPYRWLEDDNSEETANWVKSQNALTESYLSAIPFRKKIRDRLNTISNYEKFSAPFKKGKYYFYFNNSGMQNQSVLYFREGLEGEPKIAIDPNTFTSDGTQALGSIEVSRDGKYIAYQVSAAGSDWQEIRILELPSCKPLPEIIKWVKFSGISFKGNGFYYSRYNEPPKGSELSGKNEFHRIYYHVLNTDPKKDELIYEDGEHPLRNFGAFATEDEKFLVISGTESTSGNSLMFKELGKAGATWKKITDKFENDFDVIDNDDNALYLRTNYNAPNYEIISIDTEMPSLENRKIIIGQAQDPLQSAQVAGNQFLCTYLVDVQNKILRYSRKGALLGEISLPGIGMADAISSEKKSTEVFFSFSNWTTPLSVYRYDTEKNSSSLYRATKVSFDPSAYETKQVFYPSLDGTKIPMFIIAKKGVVQNGKNPCLLYGYGGFNISVTPTFSALRMVFLENGGIYAVANIRGGGEYGENWHKAGTIFNKQNVFNDFIAAAEYLFKEKYTTREYLAIHGRSNGGLLIGAVITQRPDLCRVALPGVGVLDMLRYHKFTIGWAWATDYGTSEDEKQFTNLLKYSPLQNVRDNSYPATMVITADHDDRVVPAHSFKFTATLQEHQKCKFPVLARIETKAGHGAGKPLSKVIEEWTDIWSFTMYELGMKPYE